MLIRLQLDSGASDKCEVQGLFCAVFGTDPAAGKNHLLTEAGGGGGVTTCFPKIVDEFVRIHKTLSALGMSCHIPDHILNMSTSNFKHIWLYF